MNLLSVQRGPHYDTSDDKVVVVCANYDTEENSPGIEHTRNLNRLSQIQSSFE